MQNTPLLHSGIWLAAGLLAGCAHPAASMPPNSATAAPTTLREAFRGVLHVGVAVNQGQFSGRNMAQADIITRQFDSISPENALKWENVHPRPGPDGYSFATADQYVDFGRQNGMFIVGHNLCWHNQLPAWVSLPEPGQAALDKNTMLVRLHDHILTVVGRYKGKINGWDVVNEAIDDRGGLRASAWYQICGPEYLVKAFQWAHEADPAAELYYNDYDLEMPVKRATAVALIQYLRGQGAPITGIGLQSHYKLAADHPSTQAIDDTITTFANLGLKVMITELDVDVLPWRASDDPNKQQTGAGPNPYTDVLPDDVQQALAKRLANVFAIYLKHRDAITRVTFWGLSDGQTWLNNFPYRGRTNYPLLFDRQNQPKPAFYAVLNALQTAAKINR